MRLAALRTSYKERYCILISMAFTRFLLDLCILLVFFWLISYLEPVQRWFRCYVTAPLFATYRRGAWARDPRFLAHSRVVDRAAKRAAQGDSGAPPSGPNDDDDEPCPQLVPAPVRPACADAVRRKR